MGGGKLDVYYLATALARR